MTGIYEGLLHGKFLRRPSQRLFTSGRMIVSGAGEKNLALVSAPSATSDLYAPTTLIPIARGPTRRADSEGAMSPREAADPRGEGAVYRLETKRARTGKKRCRCV